MSYTPTAGIITALNIRGSLGPLEGLTHALLTVQSEDQGLVHILRRRELMC